MAQLSVDSQLVLPESHGSAGISLSAEALKYLCMSVQMQNK